MKSIIKVKENGTFRRAYNRGKSYVSRELVVYVLKNRYGNVRLGITAGKKVGCAVMRNRAKRLLTAAFRACSPNIKVGHDIIIVARPRILAVKSTQVQTIIENNLKTAGIWCDLNCDK